MKTKLNKTSTLTVDFLNNEEKHGKANYSQKHLDELVLLQTHPKRGGSSATLISFFRQH